jgi:hypothetical protein
MNKFRKIFNSPKLLDTAELLSVTPREEKRRSFLTGLILMFLMADLLPHRIAVDGVNGR